MSNTFPSEQKKCDTNSEPQSEVTWDGTPCLEKTCRTNNFASSADMIVSWVGMNIACLVSRLTTTRIAVCLEDQGNFSMKSIEIIPGLLGYRKLLEKSIWLMTLRFGMHTSCTRLAKVVDEGSESRPHIFMVD